MTRLGSRDLRALLGCLGEIQAAVDLEDLPHRVVASLQPVVPWDSSFWTVVDTRAGRVVRLVEPGDVRLRDEDRLVERFLHQHPVWTYSRRTGDDSAHTIADFMSPLKWRRGALYNEMYRPRSIEAQISFTLPAGPGRTLGVILNRTRPSFRENERLALNLLRPHLAETYRHLEAAAATRRALAQAQSVIEEVDFGIAVIGRDGRMEFANARARRAFATFFGERTRRADALPSAVEDWLHRGRTDNGDRLAPRRSLVAERDGRQVSVRLIEQAGQSLLVLNERSSTIDAALLLGLGLTQREAEVLSWLTQGKTDAEIGAILGSRPKTVGKHLERIYQKLGVETRTAAVARAFEVVN